MDLKNCSRNSKQFVHLKNFMYLEYVRQFEKTNHAFERNFTILKEDHEFEDLHNFEKKYMNMKKIRI
jgi:hypothetical protein